MTAPFAGAGEGSARGVSNQIGVAAQEHVLPETERLRALAERAARVQDLLGDLEVALLPAGESPR